MELGHTYIVKDHSRIFLTKVVSKEEETCYLEFITFYPWISYSADYFESSDLTVLREVPNTVYTKAFQIFEKSIQAITELLPQDQLEQTEMVVGSCYMHRSKLSSYDLVKVLEMWDDGYSLDCLEITQYSLKSYVTGRYEEYIEPSEYLPISPGSFDKMKKMVDLCTSTIRNLVGI